MKVSKTLLMLFLGAVTLTHAQTSRVLNLDFETVKEDSVQGWTVFPEKNKNYVTLDASTVQNGLNSVSIAHEKRSKKSTVLNSIPAKKGVKQVVISCFVKTKDAKRVEVWMRADDNGGYVNRCISGTNDWKKIEMTLNLDELYNERFFVFGVTLRGKGKVWLDNYKIEVDGVEITDSEKISFNNTYQKLGSINIADLGTH